MTLYIKLMEAGDRSAWDEYVQTHPEAVVYHLSGWQTVITKVYGHPTYYLLALRETAGAPAHSIAGVLPLVHIKHFLFGNQLVSMPFFDAGGILADHAEVEQALLDKAVRLGEFLKADRIELRQTQPLSSATGCAPLTLRTHRHKVRMELKLPAPHEDLMESFKSKLRNQIKKPMKEGLYAEVGGFELLDDFYHIFLVHMRDLGSPVHSRGLIRHTLEEFPDRAKIMVVYKKKRPIAAGLILGFKNILENPWSSALRKYKMSSPNMLLYWIMLHYAHGQGFSFFNFGRSSPGEGTYKFKEQWGAQPAPLYWIDISFNDKGIEESLTQKDQFQKAIACWKKLPVPVTKILGPMIRKHIGL